MKLGQAVAFLFAFAKVVDAQGGVRGRELGSVMSSDYHTNHWDETITKGYSRPDKCKGAVCGLWGDPHLFTCDGLGFDCNAVGVFQFMDNFLYNIQTHYINVGAIEMGFVLGWNNYGKASYTSDIAIENVERKNAGTPEPIIQFGFPEFISHDGQARSEYNCFTNVKYNSYFKTHKNVETLKDCNKLCAENTRCDQFTWYEISEKCKLTENDKVMEKTPSNYERVVSGQADRCGIGYEGRGGDTPPEAKMYWNDYSNRKKSSNARNCPVLFWLDGELVDISDAKDGQEFYESDSGVTSAAFYGRNKIMIKTKTIEGKSSEIMLETAGDGQGELWGCHWNIFICLPYDEKPKFLGTEDGFDRSTGLMGYPDGIPSNDWVKPNGDVEDLPSGHDRRNKAAFDHCRDWCVSEKDNIVTPPKGATFDDIKCIGEEYTPITVEQCVPSPDQIREHCNAQNHTKVFQAACEIECCHGHCNITDIEEEVNDNTKLSDRDDEMVYDDPVVTDSPCTDEGEHNGLPESSCPDSGHNPLKIISSTSSDMEPIIYDIEFGEPRDAEHGRTVTFRVDPPSDIYKAYVRYEKKVGEYANDPACKSFAADPGCMNESMNSVTVGCIEYPNTPPFALFDVYFQGSGFGSGDTEIEKCCHPDDIDKFGVVKYSFKIDCGCPETA